MDLDLTFPFDLVFDKGCRCNRHTYYYDFSKKKLYI